MTELERILLQLVLLMGATIVPATPIKGLLFASVPLASRPMVRGLPMRKGV
ncbi:MAG: hypothetical protein JSV66_18770 [Trueperaceae bacterium]|nr:MAG: hypothetical protein JSV66_18770 [Trueperaceae bacterium]